MHITRGSAMPWLNITAAFAAGATLAWLAAHLAMRMRSPAAPMSDDVVLARVEERVSQIVSTPGAVRVTVEDGIVRLVGEVPADERDLLLTQLVYMPGVQRVRNALATRA